MKLEWLQRSNGHHLWADGSSVQVKVVYKPRFRHYGVYVPYTWYRDYKGTMCPSYRKESFSSNIEEAKATAAAIYLLTKE